MSSLNNACSYYRVSTDEQAQSGQSIETQQNLCRKWAQNNGYQIVGEYTDDGKSGTSLNRPALKELLARCLEDKSIRAVLVQDTDRLARNTLDHLTIRSMLQKSNIKLISISQPMIDSSPEGNLIDTIIASVNAFQSQITGRKTSKVLEEKARMGWWPGGRPPLGYKNTINPTPTSTLDKKIICIDTTMAPYIKKAFDLYATGQYSAQQITDILNNEGLRSVSGGLLQKSVLISYIRNPFYIGKIRWHDQIFQGKHEPLITPEQFEHCQQISSDHNQGACRTRKHFYLLRGYVFCYECGKRLWAEKHIKENGSIYEHYYCVNCRRNTYVDVDDLEKQVERQFNKIEISHNYTLQIMITAEEILKESRLNKNQDRLMLFSRKTKLEAAIREAEDNRFLQHSITEEAFNRIYERYNTELGNINTQISQLESDHTDKVKSLEKLLELAENIGEAYQKADKLLKRFYLKLFWEGFDVKQGRIVKSRPHKDLKDLLNQKMVRVSPGMLPRLDSDQ